MHVYTVKKPQPNTDHEFQVYIDLLQEIGIDIAEVPRTPEPGTTNRWLYVWQSKLEAQRFADELNTRLRQKDWIVKEFEVPDEEPPEISIGPLAPLIIFSIPTNEGTEFRLEPASLLRILSHFPNANPTGKVEIPTEVRRDHETQLGPVWNQVIILLTGIPDEAINRLGGVQIVSYDGDGRVLHSRKPADICSDDS